MNGEETKVFNSLKSLLNQSTAPYQGIIENEKVIKYIISSAHKKLKSIRTFNPDAAGLIVASSVEHATKIAALMKAYLNEKSTVVTYRENDPTAAIQQFRHSTNKWIISVGMISEGTNIPRLQVCCHLTNIKTEMHFRQILGRILRVTGSANQEAIMYIPAEPKLLEYAYRVKEDVPFEADVVKLDTVGADTNNDVNDEVITIISNDNSLNPSTAVVEVEEFVSAHSGNRHQQSNTLPDESLLTKSYEQMINVFGRFKQEAIALGLSDLK